MDLIPRSWTSAPESTLITSTTATSGEFVVTFSNVSLPEGVKNDELFQGYSDELLTFASITCIIFVLIGIPGNLITIFALSRCSKARNATAIFIINLSLSDLLFCCFNLPLAASTFLKRSWNHGDLLCRLFPLMRYGLLAVSLVTILLITINRYVMIGHPRVYARIYRNRYLAMMVASTWVGAFSILIPTYRGIWGTFGLDIEIGSCSILPDKNGNSPKEFLFIIAFVVPCFCIVVCYARIFYIVRKTAFRSREPANINSSMRFDKTNVMTPENNDSYQHLIDNKSNIAKDEHSGSLSLSDVLLNHHQQVLNEKGEQPHEWKMRPYLSKLREDELKYIDTSIESDVPPSESMLKMSEKPKDLVPCKNDLINETNEIVIDIKPDINVLSTENDAVYSTEAPINTSLPNGTFEALITEIPLKTNDSNTEKKSKQGLNSSQKIIRTTKRRFHNNSTINTSNASILYPGRMSQKDKRLLKMILVIFLSFVICYLPITITKLWKGVTEMHWLNISGYLLIYLTTCMNPLIYVVMSSEYRQAYWNLLRCKKNTKSTRYGGVTKKSSKLKERNPA